MHAKLPGCFIVLVIELIGLHTEVSSYAGRQAGRAKRSAPGRSQMLCAWFPRSNTASSSWVDADVVHVVLLLAGRDWLGLLT